MCPSLNSTVPFTCRIVASTFSLANVRCTLSERVTIARKDQQSYFFAWNFRPHFHLAFPATGPSSSSPCSPILHAARLRRPSVACSCFARQSLERHQQYVPQQSQTRCVGCAPAEPNPDPFVPTPLSRPAPASLKKVEIGGMPFFAALACFVRWFGPGFAAPGSFRVPGGRPAVLLLCEAFPLPFLGHIWVRNRGWG